MPAIKHKPNISEISCGTELLLVQVRSPVDVGYKSNLYQFSVCLMLSFNLAV